MGLIASEEWEGIRMWADMQVERSGGRGMQTQVNNRGNLFNQSNRNSSCGLIGRHWTDGNRMNCGQFEDTVRHGNIFPEILTSRPVSIIFADADRDTLSRYMFKSFPYPQIIQKILII